MSEIQLFCRTISLNILYGLLIFAALTGSAAAQKKADDGKKYISKPVQFERLKSALENEQLTNEKIIDTIETFGVDFALDKKSEAELRKFGASSEVIQAIRENRRTDSEDQGVSMGVINGRAIDFVKPSYPPAARAVHASGAVNVMVVILKTGEVYSATALSGHPLLRAAAEAAARATEFKPVMLNGKPVGAKGVIVYNFIAQ